MRAAVLVLPKFGYQNDAFLAAARKLGLDVIAASDDCHQLAGQWQTNTVVWQSSDPARAAEEIAMGVAERAPAAIIGVDDRTAVIASFAAERLGLPHNPPAAMMAARNKALSRARLSKAGIPVPRFQVFELETAPDALAAAVANAPYPCVAKPLSLSASRGVIRANNPDELLAAIARISALMRSPEIAQRRDADSRRFIVEEFVPGPEIALEGLLHGGELRVLAVFDKPDPLDGPFFEETLYVTPSRHPPALQLAVALSVSEGCRALGLVEGPVHAELRLSPQGPRILEIAARSIGGLCGRALRFGVGVTLEELVLRHALGMGAPPPREGAAAGVSMLPIPARGTLTEVHGVEEAKRVPLIEDVVITAHLREELVPLPEGASYFGFVFARGATPQAVEAALRTASEQVRAVVTPRLPIT
jgi:biotin carboxylase